MKYSNYFRWMMLVALFFALGAAEAYLEAMPTLSACFSVCTFVFWFAGIMAPDSEKYTPDYLKKHKGWL